jgi:hypothetical protein
MALCVSIGCRAEPAKKLIEFGWDQPSAAFMHEHIGDMEESPFDGCVYDVKYAGPADETGSFSWRVWGQRRFTSAELQAARAHLEATPLRRFRHNFLRVNVTPGDVDWYDDFSSVIENMRLAASLARAGRSAGLLLDTETYEASLFSYAARPQRDTYSWQEYAARARQRGREIMRAIQEPFPGLTLFLTFGHSVPWHVTQADGTSLSETRYGLLAPFVDGLIDGAEGQTKIVDGYELSYGYRDTSRFAEAYAEMETGLLPIVADPRRYQLTTSIGFGIWMDYGQPRYGWYPRDLRRNYFTPERFEAVVRAALHHADEYVWIYTERPRWWSKTGGRIALPTAYEEALWRARMGTGENPRPSDPRSGVPVR